MIDFFSPHTKGKNGERAALLTVSVVILVFGFLFFSVMYTGICNNLLSQKYQIPVTRLFLILQHAMFI